MTTERAPRLGEERGKVGQLKRTKGGGVEKSDRRRPAGAKLWG